MFVVLNCKCLTHFTLLFSYLYLYNSIQIFQKLFYINNIICFNFYICLQTLTKDLSVEIKKVIEFKKKIEESVLQKIKAENKLQSLKENFNFNIEVNLKYF